MFKEQVSNYVIKMGLKSDQSKFKFYFYHFSNFVILEKLLCFSESDFFAIS